LNGSQNQSEPYMPKIYVDKAKDRLHTETPYHPLFPAAMKKFPGWTYDPNYKSWSVPLIFQGEVESLIIDLYDEEPSILHISERPVKKASGERPYYKARGQQRKSQQPPPRNSPPNSSNGNQPSPLAWIGELHSAVPAEDRKRVLQALVFAFHPDRHPGIDETIIKEINNKKWE
jgi:hypothetical protein